MDKWQKRALEKKKARERQLRRRLILGGGVVIAVLVTGIVTITSGQSSTTNGASIEAAEGESAGAETGIVYSPEGTDEATVAGDDIANATTASDAATAGSSVTADSASGTADASAAGDPAAGTDGSSAADSASGTAGASAAADTSTANAASAKQNVTPVPKEAIVPIDTPAPAATPDRSDFAVDPNNQNWNYDQTAEKTIYLTFDDGPSYLTPQVLDILDAYGINATFFVTSQNPDYFYLIKEAYDRGNTIGLHTACHDYETIYTSVDAYFADLDQIAALVQEQIGYVPCFIRFPGGASNQVSSHYCEGIMSALSGEVQARGYQYWDWNAATGDGSSVTAEESVANALATESQTVVLLCHDGEAKETTVEALPAIIEEYQARGYVFKPLDRSSTVVHHEIFN